MTDTPALKDSGPGRHRRPTWPSWSRSATPSTPIRRPSFEEDRACAWTADALGRGRLHGDPGHGRHAHGLQRPRSVPGPWWWRCAPSTTPCPGWATPAATTSSPPPPSGPASGWPGWPTSSGLTVRVLGTPAEEGGGGKVAMLDDGLFDDVHAAMMIHPWPDRPARGHLPGRLPLRRDLHRQERPRLGRPVGGRQRRRRHGHRPGGHRAAAPAAPPRRPGPRHRDRRRPGGQHHPRRGHRTVHVPLHHPRPGWPCSSHGSSPASTPGPRPPAPR